MEEIYKDKIYELLFKFYRNKNKKDYHSFKAYIKMEMFMLSVEN